MTIQMEFESRFIFGKKEMGDSSRKMDVEKLIKVSDDLVDFFRDEKDVNNLAQHLEYSKPLRSQCDADYTDVHSFLQDYQKKIGLRKKNADDEKYEVAADMELDLLQKELEEELDRELLVIVNDISDLQLQSVSVKERWKFLGKLEQDELRAQ
ncbi:kinetochore protein SPC24 homolog [Actinidia eriantha]|uniref:kinetochore protein SPC24 homolog n=1 Tax=Actinidia eriantha TaxID=165200 RepID=UPI0025909EBB|nr:kinetochore protein SPC24 homolog [Actinidia eriantha]